MIAGALATYPPRADTLRLAVESVAPQLDRLVVVLNGHAEPPGWLAEHANVVPVIPPRDTRDTGKYFSRPEGADWLFTLDDDILYPPDYVAATLSAMRRVSAALGTGRVMGGYLDWTHRRARLLGGRWLRRLIRCNPGYIVNSSDGEDFRDGCARARIVEGLGTGVAVMRAADAPPFAFVESAQRFLDIRLASWCFEQGILQVCLPRPAGWLREAQRGTQPQSIFASFTRHPSPELVDEVWRLAFRNPRRGEIIDVGFAPAAGST